MKACSNVSMCGVRLRPWPEPVEILYFACVGMAADQRSRGEWDETQNLDGMFAAGAAADRLRRAEQGAGESAGCEAVGTGGGGNGTSQWSAGACKAGGKRTAEYTVAPGTAGSSLRATYAAGELLDWIDVNSVEKEDVFRWIDENVPMENSAELARAWAAVLTEAEALMRGDETAYDALDDAGYTLEQPYRSTGRVKWAAWKLLPLFTQILDRTERAEYRYEAPGDYSAVTEEALAGIWVDDASTTVLLFSEDGCRIVYPALELLGETAYAFRVRDRSSVGYCPALDIDYLQNDFSAPLVYYVSGIDDTHFWSNTQNKCFRRLA